MDFRLFQLSRSGEKFRWVLFWVMSIRLNPKLLGVEFIRIPGKSRLYDFFEIVDKDELETAFRKWVESIVDIPKDATLSIDGKKLRGNNGKNRNAVNILSAVIAEYGLIIAHKEINSKSNEIPALQELIGELDEKLLL